MAGAAGVELQTPVLDRLAAEGAKLENYYVQPLCSPTRGTFMTGRYPSHTGIGPDGTATAAAATSATATSAATIRKSLFCMRLS